MNTKLYLLSRIDLIKRAETLERLLRAAVNTTYGQAFEFSRPWRSEACRLLYPTGTSAATAAETES